MPASTVLALIMTVVAVLGGMGTLVGVLLRLGNKLTAHDGELQQIRRDLDRQAGRVDGMESAVNEIKVQNAHILERIESLFVMLKHMVGTKS